MHIAIFAFLAFLALYLLSLVLPPIWASALAACTERGLFCAGWLEAVALTGALLTGLYALGQALRSRKDAAPPPTTGAGLAFPHGNTVLVLVWLLAALVAYTALLIKVIVPETIGEHATFWLRVLDSQMIHEGAVAFLAAGIGSIAATTFSFLKHASTCADWRDEYAPWYFLRPLQGSVLGVIFYWLLRGGVLAVLPPHATDGYLELDLHGLAGVCALVGMFSRRAMIKLRETFNVLFQSKAAEEESEFEKARLKQGKEE